MKLKRKAKKGMTLIEIIISIALIAILFIPIANIAFTSMKTNSKGEKKQVASAEGQRLLEEFNVLDEINLSLDGEGNIQRYSLPCGIDLTTFTPATSTFINATGAINKELGNDRYRINVEVAKDEDIEHNITTTNQYPDSNYNNLIEFTDEYILFYEGNGTRDGESIIERISLAGCTRFAFRFMQNGIKVQKFGATGYLETIDVNGFAERFNNNNKIKIKADDSFISNSLPIIISSDIDLNIDVVNESGHTVKLLPSHNYRYIDYSNGNNEVVTMGNVTIGYNLSEEAMEDIGDVYTFTVKVRDIQENKVLFTGSITKNIVVTTTT